MFWGLLNGPPTERDPNRDSRTSVAVPLKAEAPSGAILWWARWSAIGVVLTDSQGVAAEKTDSLFRRRALNRSEEDIEDAVH